MVLVDTPTAPVKGASGGVLPAGFVSALQRFVREGGGLAVTGGERA